MTAAFLANLSALALSVLGIRQKEIFTAFFFFGASRFLYALLP
jgi:hypothetical protein